MNRAKGTPACWWPIVQSRRVEAGMSKAKQDQSNTTSFDEFMAKHSGIVNQPANPAVTGFHLLVLEHGGNISLADVMKGPRRELTANEIESRLVNQWWPVRLLREAAKEGSPDPFRTLLEYILREIGADRKSVV